MNHGVKTHARKGSHPYPLLAMVPTTILPTGVWTPFAAPMLPLDEQIGPRQTSRITGIA